MRHANWWYSVHHALTNNQSLAFQQQPTSRSNLECEREPSSRPGADAEQAVACLEEGVDSLDQEYEASHPRISRFSASPTPDTHHTV